MILFFFIYLLLSHITITLDAIHLLSSILFLFISFSTHTYLLRAALNTKIGLVSGFHISVLQKHNNYFLIHFLTSQTNNDNCNNYFCCYFLCSFTFFMIILAVSSY